MLREYKIFLAVAVLLCPFFSWRFFVAISEPQIFLRCLLIFLVYFAWVASATVVWYISCDWLDRRAQKELAKSIPTKAHPTGCSCQQCRKMLRQLSNSVDDETPAFTDTIQDWRKRGKL